MRTVKRRARVGEQIIITNAGMSLGYYENGDIFTVSADRRSLGVDIKGIPACPFIRDSEYEVIEDESNKTNQTTRLSEAEAKIATLEAEVSELAARLDFVVSASNPVPTPRDHFKTPNQRRADVIKRARAFVADLERRATHLMFNFGVTSLEFHVNTEKGNVTALAKANNAVLDKAFAKSDPDDVFNADIGKAIAAGRLYGVVIPKEFTDAPKPTEVVVGMRVKAVKGFSYLESGVVDSVGDTFYMDGHNGLTFTSEKGKVWKYKSRVTILDDTDADYS